MKLFVKIVGENLMTDYLKKQSPGVALKKKAFLEILENSQDNTCARASLLIKLQDSAGFIKKEILAQVYSCEFCETFKNMFCYRKPPVAASVLRILVFAKVADLI